MLLSQTKAEFEAKEFQEGYTCFFLELNIRGRTREKRPHVIVAEH